MYIGIYIGRDTNNKPIFRIIRRVKHGKND